MMTGRGVCQDDRGVAKAFVRTDVINAGLTDPARRNGKSARRRHREGAGYDADVERSKVCAPPWVRADLAAKSGTAVIAEVPADQCFTAGENLGEQ
jgi:hypothetical protein